MNKDKNSIAGLWNRLRRFFRGFGLSNYISFTPALFVLLLTGFTLIFLISIVEEVFFSKKPETIERVEPLWYKYDLVNGRPIYPSDTYLLTPHPFNSMEWITKIEAKTILEESRKSHQKFEEEVKGNIHQKSQSLTEDEVEDIVQDKLEQDNEY